MQIVRRLQKTKRITGGAVISRLLAGEGVEHVFGIIDGTYFGLYSTFGDHDIELITPRTTEALRQAALDPDDRVAERAVWALGQARAEEAPARQGHQPGRRARGAPCAGRRRAALDAWSA